MGDSEIKKQTKSVFNRSGEEGPLPRPASSSPSLSQVFLQRLSVVCVLLAPFVLHSRWHPDTLVLYTWHDPGEHATEAPWTCHSGHWLCPALAPANLTDRKCHRDFQVSSAVAPTATVFCSAGSAMPWPLPDTGPLIPGTPQGSCQIPPPVHNPRTSHPCPSRFPIPLGDKSNY